MKMNKMMALMVGAGMLLSSTADAGVALSKSKEANIHTMMVTNTGNRVVYGKVTIYMGNLYNGICNPGPAEPPFVFTFYPHTTGPLYLNGDTLMHDFGPNYSCGFMVLETDKQTTNDVFRLYNNGYTYFTTSPNYDEVSVN